MTDGVSGLGARMGKVEKNQTNLDGKFQSNRLFYRTAGYNIKKTVRKYGNSGIIYVTCEGVQWRGSCEGV